MTEKTTRRAIDETASGTMTSTVEQAREIVRAQGYESISHACRKLDYSNVTLCRILREGLAKNPRYRTIQVLTELGLLELVKRIKPSAA